MYQSLPAKYPEVDFKSYAKTRSPVPFSGSKKIAVIFASGEINMGRSGGQSLFGGDVLGADTLAGQLRQARNNYAIKAVVLRSTAREARPWPRTSSCAKQNCWP